MTSAGRGTWWQEWGALCLVGVLALPLFTPRVYASDEIKYFATLRSIYFDRDLHYENEYAYFISRDPVAHAGLRPFMEEVTPTGYRLNDGPIGTALFWLPFYATADLGVVVARALGATVVRDGYSWPYVWAVCVGSLVWGMAGLLLIFRLCRAYAGRKASTWGVLGIWFASPVVFYLYITPAMSHAASLFAVVFFLWLWHEGRRNRGARQWVVLGVSAGLMILVRELNWLFLLVPLVDEALEILRVVRGDPAMTTAVVGQLRRRWGGYASFAAALAIVITPQFYVYQTLNGTFGPTPFVVEKFSLVPRHVGDVLFSGFHGLFSWHPVTLLGMLGLGVLWRREPQLAGLLALIFLAQVLVIGAYDTWWGGASFGARRFINCSPIFALGIAAAVDPLRGRALQLTGAGLLCLVLWNGGLAVQYSVGLIPRDAPVGMGQIVRNQIFEVPPRLKRIAWRFAFDRSSFYRTRS